MLFLGTLWANINILWKYFFFVLLKNVFSYNEELFLFSVYIILFLIIVINSFLASKKFLINSSFELLEFYEKLIYLKSYVLKLLKKNYILLKKCEYIKIYIKKLFIKLFLNKIDLNKNFMKNKEIVTLLNLNDLLVKSNKLNNFLK